MQSWTPREEHTLRKYIEMHFREDDSIDWSELPLFLQRGTPQCKTKYYRMLNEGKWQFRKSVKQRHHKAENSNSSANITSKSYNYDTQIIESISRIIFEQDDTNVGKAHM